MTTTVVINILDAPPGWRSNPKYIYIGAPKICGDIEFDGSPFATPFSVQKDGTAFECYMKYQQQILYDCEEIFDKAVQRLPGNVVVCDCQSRLLCHGRILAAIADGQLQFQGAIHAGV